MPTNIYLFLSFILSKIWVRFNTLSKWSIIKNKLRQRRVNEKHLNVYNALIKGPPRECGNSVEWMLSLQDNTSGVWPAFVSGFEVPDSYRHSRRPASAEACSHVGSYNWLEQGGPRRCSREEKEGTRGFGHGLPCHLQCCYDSRVSSVLQLANAAMLCVFVWAFSFVCRGKNMFQHRR